MAASEKVECAAWGCGHRDAEQDEAHGRQPEAPPLPPADLEAEEAVGHDRDQDDAAARDDLDDGERGERDRRHVERPAARADEHADREPLRGPEAFDVRSG